MTTTEKQETSTNLSFQIGKQYAMRSICDYYCIWLYQVISRTAKTVTLCELVEKPGGQIIQREAKRFRITVRNGAEEVSPLGRYSMSPILTAEKIVA